VAEAIAQVLANGLKELDALQESKNNMPVLNPLFKLGNKNEIKNKKKKEEKVANGKTGTTTADYNLPKCPTSLLGARLISIELASLVAGTR
jgi:hypothetical protein